ncbi:MULTISPECIES: DUF1285 domain-containing protein [unclassified Iodidimonas]|jgi:hypothetical protein|uniref:DUF1285 domain-containing protein n=1 Tax=unclassified Iodidimonas TaxID=2626145 RepID=UPI002482A2A7|nr:MULTISPECIES: DUF1285 domain-containing protein [unclassified Iodidimonas]
MTRSKINPTKAPQAEAPNRLKDVFEAISKQRYPPVHLWEPDLCGEIDMRIKSDGTWHYMGTPINRPEMVRLFSSVLRHDDDGTYLVTPAEKLKITVEDAPFLAISVDVEREGDQQLLVFETHVGDRVIADDEHPIWMSADEEGHKRPYILVRNRLEALIARPVYYELVDFAEALTIDGKEMLGLWSRGSFFVLDEMTRD